MTGQSAGDARPVAGLERLPVWAVAAVILLLAALAHAPLRHSRYIQDDHGVVEENSIVQRGDWVEIFTTHYWAGVGGKDVSLYRPTVILSFALERGSGGPANPWISQLVNLLLHVAATLALLALVRRLGASRPTAYIAALLFAVHPVHLEAVAGIVGRAEILATLFSFLALLLLTASGDWCVDGATERGSAWRRRLAAWGAALALLLALGSKEVALATPLLMLGLEWLFRPRGGGGRAFRIDRAAALAPAALACLLYVVLRVNALETWVAVQQAHVHDNPLIGLDGVERLATALGLVARYTGLLLYPLGLSADYSGQVIGVEPGLTRPLPLAGLALLGLIVAIAVSGLIRARQPIESGCGRGRLAAMSALIFLLPYLIVGNLLFSVGTIFAERLLYLPSAGFCLGLGLVLGNSTAAAPADDRRRLVPWILAILLLAYATRSWARSVDWRDDESLFTAAVQTEPLSPRAHFILARLHADRGENMRSMERVDRAIELFPDYVAAWFHKGVLLGEQGRFEEAETAFRRVVELSPGYGSAWLNLGVAERRQGRNAEAERCLRRAVLEEPPLHRAWAELGNIALSAGRNAEAVEAYGRAIELGRPDLVERLRLAERRLRDPESR